MTFIFKRSQIWKAGNPVDPFAPEVRVILQKDDEEKARKKLPEPELGRVWILIRTEK